jgi:hypothetical protein
MAGAASVNPAASTAPAIFKAPVIFNMKSSDFLRSGRH